MDWNTDFLLSPSEIVLREEDFIRRNDLYPFIERLYLGPTWNYQLRFAKEYLSHVQDLFDRIIRKHGIKECVSFSFQIEGSDFSDES